MLKGSFFISPVAAPRTSTASIRLSQWTLLIFNFLGSLSISQFQLLTPMENMNSTSECYVNFYQLFLCVNSHQFLLLSECSGIQPLNSSLNFLEIHLLSSLWTFKDSTSEFIMKCYEIHLIFSLWIFMNFTSEWSGNNVFRNSSSEN